MRGGLGVEPLPLVVAPPPARLDLRAAARAWRMASAARASSRASLRRLAEGRDLGLDARDLLGLRGGLLVGLRLAPLLGIASQRLVGLAPGFFGIALRRFVSLRRAASSASRCASSSASRSRRSLGLAARAPRARGRRGLGRAASASASTARRGLGLGFGASAASASMRAASSASRALRLPRLRRAGGLLGLRGARRRRPRRGRAPPPRVAPPRAPRGGDLLALPLGGGLRLGACPRLPPGLPASRRRCGLPCGRSSCLAPRRLRGGGRRDARAASSASMRAAPPLRRGPPPRRLVSLPHGKLEDGRLDLDVDVRAGSRSSARRIFPLAVFGSSSTNSMARGYLYGAVIALTCSCSSVARASSASCPGRRTTNALTICPRSAWGRRRPRSPRPRDARAGRSRPRTGRSGTRRTGSRRRRARRTRGTPPRPASPGRR